MWKIMVILLALSPAAGIAHESCPQADCEETKQKIRKIESKMRQGYTRAQGEKLRDELRSLKAVRSKRCR